MIPQPMPGCGGVGEMHGTNQGLGRRKRNFPGWCLTDTHCPKSSFPKPALTAACLIIKYYWETLVSDYITQSPGSMDLAWEPPSKDIQACAFWGISRSNLLIIWSTNSIKYLFDLLIIWSTNNSLSWGNLSVSLGCYKRPTLSLVMSPTPLSSALSEGEASSQKTNLSCRLAVRLFFVFIEWTWGQRLLGPWNWAQVWLPLTRVSDSRAKTHMMIFPEWQQCAQYCYKCLVLFNLNYYFI